MCERVSAIAGQSARHLLYQTTKDWRQTARDQKLLRSDPREDGHRLLISMGEKYPAYHAGALQSVEGMDMVSEQVLPGRRKQT